MSAEKNIKLWSTLGMRATFGLIAIELAKKNPELIITTSDVSTSAGLDRFKKQHPNQYIDVGIAEQNLIGVSAGLSSEGFKVISTTFSPFQTLRCCEQIKVNLGYMKHKVCMVGLASGLVLGNLGFTHCSIEDIGSLRSIPNIAIIAPSDPYELYKVLNEAINYKDSIYIRLTAGSNSKIINEKDYDFKIGKSVEILPGKDVVIIGCGNILSIKRAIEKIGFKSLVTKNEKEIFDSNFIILPGVGKYRNYANDSAAATGGVPLYGIYHTNGALKIRVT